jgi:ribokinase
MGRVVVVGSINVDLVVHADRLPAPGETVLGGRFEQHQGGKGANAAVAAARAGADVVMIGAVGDDGHGEGALAALAAEGVDVSRVRRVSEERTGVAIIAVGPRGENQIAVAPGANAFLTPDDVGREALAGDAGVPGGVLLTNHEVPIAVVVSAVRGARHAGMTAIVNPAPAHAIPAELLALGPILTPNEHELTVAIGDDDPASALATLAQRSAGPIVVTQGAAGALLARDDRRDRFDGYPAPAAVDTTGAGDAFCGVLAAWLAERSSLEDAIDAANAAGALSVGATGARSGMPSRQAIVDFIGRERQR